MTVRILTWNVNGIRNPFKYAPWNSERSLQRMFDRLAGDIVCFQEVKTPKAALTDDLVTIPGWDAFYSFPASQTGYSGVAVYTRDATCSPLRVEEGVTGVLRIPGTSTRYVDADPTHQIGGYPTDRQLRRAAVPRDVIDSEGRCLLLEFPLFVLVNVYCPARRNPERSGFRNTFLVALDARIRNLAAAGKNVVLLGDLNIMRDQLDTAGVWGHAGVVSTAEARAFDADYLVRRAPRLLNQLLFNSRLLADSGHPPILCDTTREHHPSRVGMFTCWDTRKNHRPANYGSRIDYIACSPRIMQLVVDADIQPELHGSDHCPVYIVLRDRVEDAGGEGDAFVRDYLNPPGRYVRGQPALPPEQDAALLTKRLPQSARRLPQFANRRHIGAMFRKASQPAVAEAPPSTKEAFISSDPVPLPAVFQADPVAIVESDDDGDASNIEDDDSDVDGDDEDSEVAATAKEVKRPSTLFFPTAKPVKSGPQQPAEKAATEKTAAEKPTADKPPSAPALAKDTPAPATPVPTDASSGFTSPAKKAPLPRPSPKKAVPAKRTLTRTKSGSGSSSSSAAAAKKTKTTTSGTQTSMSMFLTSRAKADEATTTPPVTNTAPPAAAAAPAPPAPPPTTTATDDNNDANNDDDSWMTPEQVEAAFQSRDAARASWSRLGLGQLQAPLCEHGEPCKTLVTKKPGVNSGRSFFMCARPPGPLGKSEKGTAWQCTTFVWCRDWKPER